MRNFGRIAGMLLYAICPQSVLLFALAIAAASPAHADSQPRWMISTVRCMSAPPVAYKEGEDFTRRVQDRLIDAHTGAALVKLKACYDIAMQDPRARELAVDTGEPR